MARRILSTKRLQIDHANARMVVVISVATFVTVFSLASMKALASQSAYLKRVIAGKEKAVKQLKDNLVTSDKLIDAFQSFNSSAPYMAVLGQNSNSKMVLDALPSKYDFPALTSSAEKILAMGGYTASGISGVDDEVKQSNPTSPIAPQPVEMPFTVTASANYQSLQKLVGDFERSIRPFNVQSIQFSGNDSQMKLNMIAVTYYQPEKSLNITTKVVK